MYSQVPQSQGHIQVALITTQKIGGVEVIGRCSEPLSNKINTAVVLVMSRNILRSVEQIIVVDDAGCGLLVALAT